MSRPAERHPDAKMEEELAHAQPAGAAGLALSLGILLGPLAVWGDLQASYALVPRMCATGVRWPLWLPTLLAVGAIALGAALSWAQHRSAARLQRARARERARFLGAAGLSLSLFSLLALAALALPKLILGPCDS